MDPLNRSGVMLRCTNAAHHMKGAMLYTLYEAGYYASTPLRAAARLTRDFWSSPLNPGKDSELGRRLYAGADLFANLTRRYGKPAWGIDAVQIDGQSVRVRPTQVGSRPW